MVYQDGLTYRAEACTSGGTDFSGLDAATVIQDALDALTPGRTWYEKVVLKDDLTIAAALLPNNYTILEAYGSQISLANSANSHMLVADGKHHIMAMGGIWDGNSANQGANTYDGIRLMSATDIVLRDMQIQNTCDGGVVIGNTAQDCSRISVLDNYLYHCGIASENHYAISITTSDYLNVQRNIIDRGSVQGFGIFVGAAADRSLYVDIAENTIYNGDAGGSDHIECSMNFGNVTRNRLINAPEAAIDIAHCEYVTVAENICDRNRWAAGEMIHSSYDSEHCSFIGNQIYDPTKEGMLIWGYHHVVSGNTLKNCNNGIRVRADYSTISNNTIDTCTFYGINLETAPVPYSNGSNHNVIAGNTIYTTARGIYLEDNCDYNLINGNNIDVTSSYGIDISVNTCDVNSILNNILTNIANATEIHDAGTNTVKHNNYEDEDGWVA